MNHSLLQFIRLKGSSHPPQMLPREIWRKKRHLKRTLPIQEVGSNRLVELRGFFAVLLSMQQKNIHQKHFTDIIPQILHKNPMHWLTIGVGIFSHLTIRSDSESHNTIPERFLIYLRRKCITPLTPDSHILCLQCVCVAYFFPHTH